MTRVSRPPSRDHIRKPSHALLQQRQASKILNDKRKASTGYKVLLEQVAEKRKKLRLSDVTNPRPPPGFAFLSVGHADLAEFCKESSRKEDAPVSIVSAVVREEQHKAAISKHLHRIGYHFRQDIFDQGCKFLGYRVSNGKLLRDGNADHMWGFAQITDGYMTNSDSAPERTATEQEALTVKLAIKELFPKIPHSHLEDIWRIAWKDGARTVGNASHLPLSRRVQLATIAHVRHEFTEYDNLLRQMSWAEARQAVQQECLTKLLEWRDESDDGQAFEEAFREVIVIDDEDEGDHHNHYGTKGEARAVMSAETGYGSDTSLEIIAQPADVADVAPERDGERLQARYARRLGIPLPKIDTRAQGSLDGTRHPSAMQTVVSTQGNTFGHGHADTAEEVEHIVVPVDQYGRPPTTFFRDGVMYARADSNNNAPARTAQPRRAVSGFQVPAAAHLIDLTSPPRPVSRALSQSHGPVLRQPPPPPPTFPQVAPHQAANEESPRWQQQPPPATASAEAEPWNRETEEAARFKRVQRSLGFGLQGGPWADVVKRSTEQSLNEARMTRSQLQQGSNGISTRGMPVFDRSGWASSDGSYSA